MAGRGAPWRGGSHGVLSLDVAPRELAHGFANAYLSKARSTV